MILNTLYWDFILSQFNVSVNQDKYDKYVERFTEEYDIVEDENLRIKDKESTPI